MCFPLMISGNCPGEGWVFWEDSCYLFMTNQQDQSTWEEAVSQCADQAANLVSVLRSLNLLFVPMYLLLNLYLQLSQHLHCICKFTYLMLNDG